MRFERALKPLKWTLKPITDALLRNYYCALNQRLLLNLLDFNPNIVAIITSTLFI